MLRDGVTVVLLLLGTALYAAALVVWAPQPFEDAAILMRYAQHLAEGHGIVWNVGEPPVDGATDFLFMLLLAGLHRGGLGLEAATRAVGILSHLATVVLIYAAVRRLHGTPRWMAATSAAYLAVGPGLSYASAGFGTPFFVLFAALTWHCANRLAAADPERESGFDSSRVTHHASRIFACWPLLFALSGLVMGLIRPEGVFLALFMLGAVVFVRGLRASWKAIAWFIVVFGVLGGAYFAWRWWYFGQPLPNPFYKKGGGMLHWGALVSAIRGSLTFSLPFALPFIAGFRSRATARWAVFALIPIGGFVGIWVLMSDAMNYLWRFQYAVQPIVLMSWPPLVAGLAEEWRLPRWSELARRARVMLGVLGGIVFMWLLVYHYRASRLPVRYEDGNAAIGRMLRDYSRKGYTMAVSEAGLLPFYSRWRALDTWGLNDQAIARTGRITEERLAAEAPHIIAFHAYFSPLVPPVVRNEWDEMVVFLQAYAQRHGYILAAVYGETPYDTQHFYVRPDFPDAPELLRRIRSTPYTQMSSGRACLNFAPSPPEVGP